MILLATLLTFVRFVAQAIFSDNSTNTEASVTKSIASFVSRDKEGIQVTFNSSASSPILASKPAISLVSFKNL
jgi:hypothetical protein